MEFSAVSSFNVKFVVVGHRDRFKPEKTPIGWLTSNGQTSYRQTSKKVEIKSEQLSSNKGPAP